MEKIFRKFNSFEEAEKADIEYWQNASYDERINTLLIIQQRMLDLFYPDVKRMDKVFKIRKKGEEE